MKRLLCLLFAASILASCTKDLGPEPVWITLSQQTALLRSAEGATATFTVTAHGKWTLTQTGEGFDVSATEGDRGETSVIITARQENTDRYRQKLGSITVHYTANGLEYPLDVAQSPVIAPQTMLLYMPGRSLLDYYMKNIEGIKDAVSAQVPGDGRILVCYQPKGSGLAELMEIYYDADAQQCAEATLKTYDSFAPENPLHVQQMFTDAATEAPAQKYGLIIGCHGKAWLPIGKGLTGYGAPRPGGELGPFGPLAPGAKKTRSFGDSGHELEISDLAAAITAQDYRFEYLVFDACFMANIETLYDLRNAAGQIIASPCEIMGAGFPYKRIVPWLFTDGGAMRDLQRVCEEFWKFYMYDWNTVPRNEQSGCISLAVSAELEPLSQVMRRINATTAENPDVSDVQAYEPFMSHLFFDLGDYVRTVCKDAALLEEFTAQFARAFPEACRLHTPSFYSGYNGGLNLVGYYSGVSLSGPSESYTALNQQTAWHAATH